MAMFLSDDIFKTFHCDSIVVVRLKLAAFEFYFLKHFTELNI